MINYNFFNNRHLNSTYVGSFEHNGIHYGFVGNWVPYTAGEQELKVWVLTDKPSDRWFENIIGERYGYFAGVNVFEQLEAKLQGLDHSAIAKYS